MPIFEYKCKDCGSKFEKLVRGAAAEIACPSCGQDHVSREHSTFSARANGRSKESAPSTPCGNRCPTPGLCGQA